MDWLKLGELPRIPVLLMWTGWTLLLCFLLLSPSDGTVETISGLFGGTEITDAIGHVIMMGVECVLMYLVMKHYLSDPLSRKLALICTLMFGIFLELAQLWIPSRGTSVIDIIAAFVGVSCAYLMITKLTQSSKNEWA